MKSEEAKFEIKSSGIQGKGLFAIKHIKKGEVVVEWHPKVISKSAAAKLSIVDQEHYLYPDGDYLLWMQPPERYMNHSCSANTRVVGKSDVASRNIKPGEEITSDYLDLETENFECNCGSLNCRKPSSIKLV